MAGAGVLEYYFFKSVGSDRQYTADQFSERFRDFLGDGILTDGAITTEFEVTADDTTLNILVGLGVANVYGYFAVLKNDTATLEVTAGDSLNPRIDLVVLRVDVTEAERDIKLVIKEGTPGTSPTAPIVVQDLEGSLIYEIGLAEILVPQNAALILNSNVTDVREQAVLKALTTESGKLKNSANDTTSGYFEDKFLSAAGSNATNVLEFTIQNEGGNETRTLQIDVSKIDHDSLQDVNDAAAGVSKGHITAGVQTIYGVKTFDSFPVTPSSSPTTDYQVANKKYVDDTTSGVNTYAQKTANYTATTNDYIVEITANDVEITAYTAVGNTGKELTIKNTGSGLGKLLFNGAETADGRDKILLGTNQSVIIAADGTNWTIVNFNEAHETTTVNVDTGTVILDSFSCTDSNFRSVIYEYNILKNYKVVSGLYIISFTEAGDKVVSITENLGIGRIDVTLSFDDNTGNIRFKATAITDGWKVTFKQKPLYMEVPTPTATVSIGYWFGGVLSSGSQDIIQGIDHNLLTQHVAAVTLSVAKYYACAASSSSYAYVFAGSTGAVTNVIERMAYATTETISTLVETLDNSRYRGSSGYNIDISIYINGGFTTGYTNSVEKFTISTETTAANNTNLDPSIVIAASGAASMSTHQYVVCGTSPTVLTSWRKMDYATDTFSTGGTNFVTAVFALAVTSLGEFLVKLGGYTGSGDSAVLEKLTYSTDTISAITDTLSVAKHDITANHSLTHAYIAGTLTTGIESFSKATETVSTETAVLDTATSAAATTQSGGL